MVDNADEPGTHEHGHEPPAGSHPAGDFPADFFDDDSETPDAEAGHPTPAEAVIEAHAEPDPSPLPPRAAAFEEAPIPAAALADAPLHHPAFPIVVGMILVGMLAVAIVINMKTPEAANAATAATPAPSEAPKTEPAADATDAIKALDAKVDGIGTEVKGLQARIEATPKTDLKPIEDRISHVAKTTEAVAPLPKQVGHLDERIGALDKAIGTLRDELGSLRKEVKKATEQAAAASAAAEAFKTAAPKVETTTAPAPTNANVNASNDLDEGAKLFKAGKYKEADDYFRKLTDAKPDDARLWYYAALSHGSATNQWTGETERLVKQGIEREKAGTPALDKINSAFSGVAPTLKPWLEGWRKFAAH